MVRRLKLEFKAFPRYCVKKTGKHLRLLAETPERIFHINKDTSLQTRQTKKTSTLAKPASQLQLDHGDLADTVPACQKKITFPLKEDNTIKDLPNFYCTILAKSPDLPSSKTKHPGSNV